MCRAVNWCDPRSRAEEPWDWRLTFPGGKHGSHAANGDGGKPFHGEPDVLLRRYVTGPTTSMRGGPSCG
jgi:hypothetical protein